MTTGGQRLRYEKSEQILGVTS